MPTPTTVGVNPTWVLGYSDPSTFFVGYYSTSGNEFYPLSGLGWSMSDTPQYSTLEQKTAGGRAVLNPLYQNPLHNFKLTFNVLNNEAAYGGNPDTDFRLLYSFYNQMAGKFGEFLYKPRESAVVHQPLALPDTNGYVELVCNLGPFFAESVQELNYQIPTVYRVNAGVYTDITSTCSFYTAGSIAPYPGIAFSTTTSLGVGDTLAASYNFFYRVHFDNDGYSFEEFMYQLMKVGIGLTHIRI